MVINKTYFERCFYDGDYFFVQKNAARNFGDYAIILAMDGPSSAVEERYRL